ncbi:MAG: hypothetical protein ABIY70_12970 [Capsulimonas sp.]|uniref:hypothetical protein n=1 Tax=Capsulimonas sp. TaxID=2494211 RepID=UPI003266232A
MNIMQCDGESGDIWLQQTGCWDFAMKSTVVATAFLCLAPGANTIFIPTTPPDVPVKWKGYLLTKIVQGRVIRMINNKSAMIDVGSSDGLKPGMELIEEKSGEPFEVIACDMHSAKVRRFESPVPRPASPLKVGASVISRYKDEADR